VTCRKALDMSPGQSGFASRFTRCRPIVNLVSHLTVFGGNISQHGEIMCRPAAFILQRQNLEHVPERAAIPAISSQDQVQLLRALGRRPQLRQPTSWRARPESRRKAPEKAFRARSAKELDQPCLAFGKRVPAPLRDHEGEWAHVPYAPLEFDE